MLLFSAFDGARRTRCGSGNEIFEFCATESKTRMLRFARPCIENDKRGLCCSSFSGKARQ